MADKIFNIALGAIKTYTAGVGTGNQAFVLLLCKSSGLEADATIVDHDNISTLLAGTTDECDFTNYARKTITAAAHHYVQGISSSPGARD